MAQEQDPYKDPWNKPTAAPQWDQPDPWQTPGPYPQPSGSYPDDGYPDRSDPGQYTGVPSQNERLWALLCHLSSFAIFFFPTFGNIIAPLIIWLLRRDQSQLVNDQGKESLNFQISVTIYLIVSIALSIVLIGIPLLIVVLLFQLIMVIVASVKAYEGTYYRYPFTIRFIK